MVKKDFHPLYISYIYIDETLEENYFEQIIVVLSIKRPRHTTTPLSNRVFGQEGEEEFLSSIRNNRLPRDASTKFQDTWFVKKIFIHSIFPIYKYIDETLEENYFKQIIVVSSIERPRHTITPLSNRVFGQKGEEEFLSK